MRKSGQSVSQMFEIPRMNDIIVVTILQCINVLHQHIACLKLIKKNNYNIKNILIKIKLVNFEKCFKARIHMCGHKIGIHELEPDPKVTLEQHEVELLS